MTALKLADNISNITPPSVSTNGSEKKKNGAAVHNAKFPIEVYPSAIQKMLTELADRQGLPLDYTGTMLLSFLSSAVGASVKLQVSGEWYAPLCVWTCIIGDSGTRKTPVIKFLSKPFVNKEQELQRLFDVEKYEYQQALKIWEKDKTQLMPTEPQRRDILVKTGSIEGLKQSLFKNPRGVLLVRDEFSGFIRGLNQYKGKGDDQSTMLELFNGDELKDNFSTKGTSFVPFTNTCLSGGIQAELLPELLSGGRDSDGFIFRFLFAMPSGLKKNGTIFKEGVSSETTAFYKRLIFQLFNIDFATDEWTEKVSNIVTWCNDGFSFFEKWYAQNAAIINDSEDKMQKGVLNKLEGILPRLALLLELVSRQCDDLENPINPAHVCVTAGSCERALKLIEYFKFNAAKMQTYVCNNPVKNQRFAPSGIDWYAVFEKRKEMKRGDILIRFVKLKETDSKYNISPRSIDSLLDKELYRVPGKYGFFTHIDPADN